MEKVLLKNENFYYTASLEKKGYETISPLPVCLVSWFPLGISINSCFTILERGSVNYWPPGSYTGGLINSNISSLL